MLNEISSRQIKVCFKQGQVQIDSINDRLLCMLFGIQIKSKINEEMLLII